MLFSCSFLHATSAIISLVVAGNHVAFGQEDGLVCGMPANYDGLGVTVPCDADFVPENCDFEKIPLLTVEDYDRCGPARLNQTARTYFLGAGGRRLTYNDNKAAYKRIRIVPKLLRDVSGANLSVTTLGQRVNFPIGFSPVASQNLADPEGELATARAVSTMGTIMILSSYASTRLEDVARAVNGGSHLWMQTYIFRNRTYTSDIVHRAERAGYEAIVVTIDSPLAGTLTCSARNFAVGQPIVNIPGETDRVNIIDDSLTHRDLAWLVSITNLPIVAKGVLSANEAKLAVKAGVKAILVSNHGGRQLDGDPATIDVITDIRRNIPSKIDLYIDGGVRNGWSVYKAIAAGAKMVFMGRPIVYGLAINGQAGVSDILNIMQREFYEAMKLAGSRTPAHITRDTIVPSLSTLPPVRC